MPFTLRRLTAVVITSAFLSPSFAAAQAPRAGVVTTLEGNVTARRVALPAPVPLKFKDDVFLQDTVTTADKSLARMLLGGKAVVTVRERTVLTITEIPGKSTIDLESGKFALAVAREKMRPGEEIVIRTPNAVAGVRGTVVVTEVARQGAQAGGGNPAPLTSFYVLRGSIFAQQLDPTTRQPLGTPLNVGTLQAYSQLGGALGRINPVSTQQLGQITAGLQPSGPKSSDAGKEQVKSQAMETAVALVAALTGDGDSQQAFLLGPSGLQMIPLSTGVTVPILPPIASNLPPGSCQPTSLLAGCSALPPEEPVLPVEEPNQPGPEPPQEEPPVPPPPPPAPKLPRLLSGTIVRPETAPLVETDTEVLSVADGQSLITVAPGADVTLASQLAHLTDSVIVGSGHGIDIRGKITSTHPGAFVDLDPALISTLISVQGSFFSVIGVGAELNLAGSLLKGVGGVLVSGAGTDTHAFFTVQDGGVVRGTSLDPFISLTDTVVISQGSFFNARRSAETPTTVELAGPFLNAIRANILALSTTLQDQSGAPRLCCGFFGVGQGALLSSTTTLPLVSLVESVLTLGQHVFVFFDTTSIFGESTITLPATAMLAGALLHASAGTDIAALSDFLGIFRSAVSSTTTDPFITLEDSFVAMGGASPINSATTAGRFLNLSANEALSSSLTLDGPLLNSFNSFISTTDDVFGVFNGAVLASTTPSPLITVEGGSVTAGPPGSFFIASSSNGIGSQVTLDGPLLAATDTTLVNGTPGQFVDGTAPSFISFRDGAMLTSSTDAPFVSLLRSTVHSAGNFFDVRRDASVLMLGPLLDAVDSTIDVTSLAFGPSCCNVLRLGQGASVLSFSSLPFVTLTRSSINAGPDGQGGANIVRIADLGSLPGEPAKLSEMTLFGPLISASQGSNLTSVFNTLSVERSVLSGFSGDPLIQLSASNLMAGARLALVISSALSGDVADPAAVALSGSLLNASNGSTVDTVSDLIGVFNGGVLSTSGNTPLVALSDTTLTVGRQDGPDGNVINVQGVGGPASNEPDPATVVVSAGLLAASGGLSTIRGAFVRAGNGGQLVSEHPTLPLVSIDGGSHSVAADADRAALELVGRIANVAPDSESGLAELGTDEPLRHTGTGAFINVSGGATVNAQSIAKLDTALLEASAPLLNLTGAGTAMTVAVSGLDLVNKAKLTSTGPLFSVHAGVLNINGHAVRAMGASFLKIGGDLFKISGGGLVNITNGAAIFAKEGSVVNITGGIVNFVNGGGTFNLSNSLCSGGGCVPVGNGINVLATNGATVTVNNPIKNPGNGTLNIGQNAAAIVADGAATKVTVSGAGM